MSLLLFCNLDNSILKNDHWSGNFNLFPPLFQTISRCNYKPDIFDYKLIVPSISDLSKITPHVLSWEELMDLRSAELSKINEQIFILYSGGIDSVGICASIIKNWSVEDQKKITILCTPQSYYEFPEFFKTIVKNWNVKYLENNLDQYAEKGYLISGMIADYLFLDSGLTRRAFDLNIPFINYKDGILKIWTNMSNIKIGKEIFEKYHQIIEDSMYPIDTTLDFISWFNFSQFYQKGTLSHLNQKNSFLNLKNFSKVINFHDTIDFQLWHTNNRDIIFPKKSTDYKLVCLDYINNIINLENYISKKKFPSYGQVISGNKFNHGLTDDWKFISYHESLKFLLT
jgi:hypothetical protein